ncbi:glycosyltransferase family 15 protein [Sporormia fimetaria CBS 119925]|uniref:Glycosyltransferase family 15 protein n=1 Tax=Sporormia fimetaria CBS 119925 TaxID=1340428 RepID=A0A6A6V6Q2_9PLEO|nr:glycosyltransferase family 15 protein [Sporormia fimetaria CBS 119925]
MALPRSMRLVAAATFVVFCYLLFLIYRAPSEIHIPTTDHAPTQYKVPGWDPEKKIWDHDPQLDPSGEPSGPLRRVQGNNYDADNPHSDRLNATIMSLVRNSEVDDMVRSMQDLERTWNHKFNYPWTFFNDEPFSEEFKRKTRTATKAHVSYELIPPEHWAIPSWINMDLYNASVSRLTSQGVQYMSQTSYHQMCRWNSGFFSQHPALASYQYYWRVEPKVHFFCDIDYDIFAYMRDHNKTYGFNINIYDSPESVATLWPHTLGFLQQNPGFEHRNSARKWLEDGSKRPENKRKANGYSTCHFWSNFEIGDLGFWRSETYRRFFEHLDKAGGFFYERWGDAPVHSVALGLFEDKSKIHWFRDIGYQHIPFFNCPNNPKCEGCVTGRFTDGEKWLTREDCRPLWFKHVGMD